MNLPETGFVRLPQLIGQSEVTPEQAAYNKMHGKGPRISRPAIAAMIPWSKSKLWDAVRKREFPAPVKLSARTSAWTVESIKAFIEQNAEKAA